MAFPESGCALEPRKKTVAICGMLRSTRTGRGEKVGRSSLVAQLLKNPAAMKESVVRFLGREVPL